MAKLLGLQNCAYFPDCHTSFTFDAGTDVSLELGDEFYLNWGADMILVTGASGNVGTQVLKALARTGQPLRALYRNERDASNVPPQVNTVVADFADPTSMDRALEGIDKVFLVCGPVPQLVELESKAIGACKKAGVKHLVLNSALGAGTFNSSFPRWHAQVEEVLKRSGVPYTIVRPNSFMQNLIIYYAPTIRTQGAFYASMGKSRVSFIDTRDIGEFVARLFATAEHQGKTYELNGPEALNYDEVAERISQATGRPARYVDIPVSQLRQSLLGSGMPEWQADALIELQRYYTEGGGAVVNGLVARVIGREPMRVAQFVREFAAEFTNQAKSA
jgi:uncharacterized protein YbjT (DUF2867 family)